MANRHAHRIAGSAFGGTAAFLLARDQAPAHRLVETLGGGLAGGWGGRLPDVFEPALHPWHRSTAHALVPAGAVGALGVPRLRSGQARVRQWAERCRTRRDVATSKIEQFLWWLAEMLCRLAAGAMAGAPAGYASHLLLDAATPRGLPLFA